VREVTKISYYPIEKSIGIFLPVKVVPQDVKRNRSLAGHFILEGSWIG